MSTERVLCAVLLCLLRGSATLAQCGEAPSDSCFAPRELSGWPGTQEVIMGVASAEADLAPSCGVNVGHSVWFRMTPFVSGLLTFNTCHPLTSYDTVVQAYSGGECEILTPVGCVDDTPDGGCDNGCSGRGSMISFDVTAGTTYYFQISSYNQNSGGCTLCLGVLVTLGANCGENPTDFCQIPRVLPGSPGVYSVAMDVSSATPDVSMTCGSNPGHTVWFEVTPEISGPVEFSTCTPQTAYDTIVQSWIPGDAACQTLANNGCNDDTLEIECENGCSGYGSKVAFDGTAGKTYLFSVASFNTNSAQCDLCLGATLTLAECDENSDCDDGNLCTDDFCDVDGLCQYEPDDTNACADGDLCNGEETCSGGDCLPGTPVQCDDGIFCNGEEFCRGGECVSGAPPCILGQVCDEAAVACREDCNVNGVADAVELESGTVRDQNANGVIDDCEILTPRTLAGLRLLEADSLLPPRVRFENGKPAFVTMQVPLDPAAGDDPVVGSGMFLDRYRDLYGFPRTIDGLYLRRIEDGETQHLFFGQHFFGIPVHGSEIAVHVRSGHVVATHGAYVASMPLPPPSPALLPLPPPEPIHEASALELALAATPATGAYTVVPPRLVYYNPALFGGTPDQTVLVWRVPVRGHRLGDGAGSQWTAFLDAFSGDVVEVLDETLEGKDYDLSTAVNDTSSTCWFWPHSDPTIQWFTEGGATGSYPGGQSNWPGGDADGDKMYEFTKETYDFFRWEFGRRSFDNDDEQIEAYVHVGVGWANASANSICLKFGDGWVTRDIYAHEWTHAMIRETSDLEYKNQSGALNESYADVFGIFVDKLDFFIGEDLTAPGGCAGAPVGAIRSLANPPTCGDPDHMANYVNTTGDNGGVHTNSSIMNKAAYLLLEGGTHNNIVVLPLADWQVRKLYYQVVNYELTSNSTLMDARDATVRVAQEWATPPTRNSFDTEDVCKVINAFASVGLGTADSDCDGQPDTTDTDDDADQIPDSNDNCPTIPNPDQTNTDGASDGGDPCDPDDDNDTIRDDGDSSLVEGDNPCSGGATFNCDDNCVTVSNPTQADADNDGIGDVCEDDDHDTVYTVNDNCPFNWNKDQADLDRDGRGDACDTDDDNDGIADDQDSCPRAYNYWLDDDGDGVDDVCDNCLTVKNPGQNDNENDGVGDLCDPDDDNDGVPDGEDVCPRKYDPDQTGIACNDNILRRLEGTRNGQPLKLFLPFPEPDVADSVRIPFSACGGDCPGWLPSNFRTRVTLALPADLPVLVLDDRDRAVARGGPGTLKTLSFEPRAGAHFDTGIFGVPAALRGGRGYRTGMGSSDQVISGKKYTIVIYTAPEVQATTYPVTVAIQSFTPAPDDLNADDIVDGVDYRIFFDALRGPGVQTTDSRADFDYDGDTDLHDYRDFQRDYRTTVP